MIPAAAIAYLAVFILGLIIGSFLNVCIYRLPIGGSVTDPPRSVCPKCSGAIPFYDNIPVLSYLWLRGRCRHCRAAISIQYPLVEIAAGSLAILVAVKFGVTLQAAIYYVLVCALLVVSVIDLHHRIIPDIITLPGIPLGLVASLAIDSLSISDALVGMAAGGGSLWAVAWIYRAITGKTGMGGGDIKLMAMIGALLGLEGVVFTIFVASALGSVVGLTVMLCTRSNLKLAVPFGPFLSLGATGYVFFGPEAVNWYFSLLG
jgi:leader peptidase (prepilin peptidase)/N-methyltransferase